jgi:hypothetical protein
MTSIIVQGVIFLPFRQFVGGWAERVHHHRAHKAQERGGNSHPVSRRSLVEWFNELINCTQCTGFWCGLFCGLFLISLDGYWITAFDPRLILNRLLMWFCCGLGGSFLAALGCNVIDWVFYRKMNALRHLEEQDLMLAARQVAPPEIQE